MENKQKPKRRVGTGRSLRRYSKRIIMPTFIAGLTSLALFLVITKDDSRSAEPYVARSSAASLASDYRSSGEEGVVERDPTTAVLSSLEPQMERLSRKIDALENASETSWAASRDEVVEAWETFDATYQAISDSLADRG